MTGPWLDSRLTVRESAIHGMGSFATATIRSGERVTVWDSPESAPVPEAERGADERLNHSCDPNLWMSDDVTLCARRDIYPGDELVADYAMWERDDDWVADWICRCGSALCRLAITGRDWRLPELREWYAGHFSSYNQGRIARREPRPLSRVLILGAQGAGKTTLARRLAASLGAPATALDELFWQSFEGRSPEASEIRSAVREVAATPRWIVDGNHPQAREILLAACDAIVWLEPPRELCVARLVLRRLGRIGRRVPPYEWLSASAVRAAWGARERLAPLRARVASLEQSRAVLQLRSGRQVSALRREAARLGSEAIAAVAERQLSDV